MANTLGLGISSKLDRFVANQEPGVVNYGSTEGHGLNFDKTLCNERRFSASQGQATGRSDSRMLPALTSTPILSRQENTTSCGPSSQTIHSIINRIFTSDSRPNDNRPIPVTSVQHQQAESVRSSRHNTTTTKEYPCYSESKR